MPFYFPNRTGKLIRIPPPLLLAILYLALILIGAVVLVLPIAVTHPISFSDALFTATSAVTVTGLAVVDTGSSFTLFGQAMILILIQLGGLGLMTFAALVLSALGLPIGLRHHSFLREDLNQTSLHQLVGLVKTILAVVLFCELIGSILLLTVFVPDFGWARGTWFAVFHSVSAFNNAGFALMPDSLSRWATNPVINLTIPALLLIGGIGFSVISDLWIHRGWRHLSLHSKLMLTGSAILIVWSVTMFAILEWYNPDTLGAFANPIDKLQISWFQGLTTRTAGFNTVDIGSIHDTTALMFILLMVIGAGSTSTAGGIKVTTFIVLVLATIAFFKRHNQLHAFGRSIGLEEVMKVLALTMISMFVVMTGIFLITVSHDGDFLDLVFEVTSAFGTVGLSRGTTGELDTLGRIVIELIMFIGRVGPLTLGFFLARRVPPRISYPSSQVYLG
ncbi:TrkH family potassium uptake protein [Thalassospira xianhensis]|uniref:Ktr system potassium transporter B n=1 Tax=Thalassospira xianhensis MCCC 1A02616 TaxID=1177929 RepID=A0A367UCX4_9PROT|nr:TrkH family potassium uptake protein [Thalassospira xianhensis]RCK06155.1 Ktr system potassium transporter B [Thalassospira xianhensis MCCC 1A02616]